MDLIYTNANREDVGVLLDYEFDLAFGHDENDFECSVPSKQHCMEDGSFLYVEGTEYGGVVDGIEVDTESETVIYKGRTWHGILAGKIIEPEPGYDYHVVNGEANAVLAELIDYLGLSDVFSASTEESDFQIVSHAFDIYTDAYSGIRKMLAEVSAKLKMTYDGNTVILSAIPLVDYSQGMEFDNTQIDFNIKKNFRPVNHLICLGSGNLKNRFVIHLFTDENGGVQAHKKTDYPLSDEDYILDKSKQVLFGTKEVTDVYDCSSAQTTENFVKLTEQPTDWLSNYTKYFKLDENNSYVNMKGLAAQEEKMLTERPEDWEDSYANYCEKTPSGNKAVEAVTTTGYRMQYVKPSDWETNYGNYYCKVGSSYGNVSGVQKEEYVVLTQKPSDWNRNWRSYYTTVSVSNGGVTSFSGYETLGEVEERFAAMPIVLVVLQLDVFKPKKYYDLKTITVAPPWKEGTYFTIYQETGAPEWQADKYFSVVDIIAKPPFIKNGIFEKKYDHYADLVTGGLERLKASYNCDSIDIDLDLEGDYDIGDIVGASESVTGLSTWQPISKKIVTIKNGRITISYKVGE